MDIIFSAALLVFLSPLLLVIGLLIKLISKGPIFYPWKVVGENGMPFTGYKFRTMDVNADLAKEELLSQNEMKGPVFKIKNDPRVTSLGKLLRKFSLDELPQLWSVLKGDMSLVGPRPPATTEYLYFEEWQKQKLSVKPGMTCFWQINGRNEINDFNEWVKLDLKYIQDWSLWLDVKILLRTILVVFRGTGR